jgi:hypothetical protein
MTTYRVRHIDGRYLWWRGDSQSFTCCLSTDPYRYNNDRAVSTWNTEIDALHAMGSTVYGTKNLRLITYEDGIEVAAREYSRFFERFKE